MAKRKKIALEEIPTVLEKIVALIDREVNSLSTKIALSSDEAKNLIAYAATLTNVYKDYRAEVLSIQKDLKSKSKEEIMAIVKAESN